MCAAKQLGGIESTIGRSESRGITKTHMCDLEFEGKSQFQIAIDPRECAYFLQISADLGHNTNQSHCLP